MPHKLVAFAEERRRSAMESNQFVVRAPRRDGMKRESGRKPRTEAHFEAMRKRADALEEYVNLLESVLEKCRREHGGVHDNGQSYLQFRPRDAEGMILPDDVDGDDNDDTHDDDRVFSQELCLPTRNLKLEEGNLLLHGNTAVFRFAPEHPLLQPTSRFPLKPQSPRYVLLVEGLEENNYNPDFDWSRYLPASVPLDRREHDKLLDLVFKFFMSWCLRIVPDLFLRDMYHTLSTPRSQTPPKTAHYSPMLHNALMAVATAFSDDPRIRDHKARQAFATLAKSYVEAECQQPNISVVHGLSTLGSYHSGLGEQTLGYLYFVGLSIDCSAWVRSGLITENDMFDRNWAFWTIFTQDVCWSLYVGRDFSIPSTSGSESKRISIPFVDAEFDSVQWYYPPSGIAPQPNILSKTFAASCELLMIARRIMDVVNGLNNASVRHEVNDELISNIEQRPTDRDIDHVKLCKRAAENIVELLGTWRSLYTLRYAPITLVQTAFSAGTIYLLGAVQAATGLRVAQESLKHALAQAQLCVQYLLEIGKSWQCATNIGEILRRLLQDQLRPLLEKRAIRSDGVAAAAMQNQNQNPTQLRQRSKAGPSTSPSPSIGSLTRRRRSPSQRRSSSTKDEIRTRGRPIAAFQTTFSPSGSSSHRSPLSSSHRSPVPSLDPDSQPQSPSLLSLHRSSSMSSMAFGQTQTQSSWTMDYTPTSPVTDDGVSPLFQNFSGTSDSRSSMEMGIDIDFGAMGTNQLFDANINLTANASMDMSRNVPSLSGVAGSGIDPSSFLAMLGGEPLSDAPFLPTFDSYSPPSGEGGPYSPRTQHASPSTALEGFEAATQGIPESDLVILAQFWDQNFA
ncbi:hypothetical protein DXG01_015405 [Tephrocybe rancida]|nr:hypothetical protein DXG01_015405 [Tephrocybe rancida]